MKDQIIKFLSTNAINIKEENNLNEKGTLNSTNNMDSKSSLYSSEHRV